MGGGKVRRSGDSPGAEGAEVERHRIKAPREVGCGEASEEELCPSSEICLIFELKNVEFRCIWGAIFCSL